MTSSVLINRAGNYLASCGITVLDRNWQHPHGVIDLIAEERGQLVVVRVVAHPAPLVAPGTVRRLRQLAVAWMTAHGKRYERVRVDLIAVRPKDRAQYDLEHERDLENRGGVR